MQDGLDGVVKQKKFLADHTSKRVKCFRTRASRSFNWDLGFQEQVYVSLEELRRGHQYVASEVSATPTAQRMQPPNPTLLEPRAANTPWGAKIAPGRTLARLGKHGFVLDLVDRIDTGPT
jgi:hypothetical protein